MPKNTLERSSKTVYFLHIPKTAGTSFTHILDSLIGMERTLPTKVWNDFKSIDKSAFNGYKFIRGHFGYGVHKYTGAPTAQITFLRDPVERTISQVNHIMVDGKRSNWVYEDYYKGESLQELIQASEKNEVFSNLQTKYIANRIDVIKHLLDKNLDPQEFRFDMLLAKRAGLARRATDLITALYRIRRLEFVGIQEYFEESLMLFCYRFEFAKPTEIPFSMMKPGRPKTSELNSATIGSIQKLNKSDTALYWFGKKVFTARYRKMLKNLLGEDYSRTTVFNKDLLWERINARAV